MIFLKILLWILLIPIILLAIILLLVFIATILPLKVRVEYENENLLVWFKCLFYKKQLFPHIDKPEKPINEKSNDVNLEKTPEPIPQNGEIAPQTEPIPQNGEIAPQTEPTLQTEPTPQNVEQQGSTPKADIPLNEKPQQETNKPPTSTACGAEKPKTTVQKPKPPIIDLSIKHLGTAITTATGLIARVLRKIKFTDIWVEFSVYDADPCKSALKYGKVNAYLYSLVASLENVLNMRFEKVDIKPDFKNEFAGKSKFAVTIKDNFLNLAIAFIWAFRILYKGKIIFPKGFKLFKKKKRRKRRKKPVKSTANKPNIN